MSGTQDLHAEAAEQALAQIEADAFRTLNASWVKARRARKRTRRATGQTPTYGPFPTDLDELLQGPWMQAVEQRLQRPRPRRLSPEQIDDVRVLRAFHALVLVRETRQHLIEGHAHQAVVTALEALHNASPMTDADLFRRPRLNASIETNRKKRGPVTTRQKRARDLASYLGEDHDPHELAALVAQRFGMSLKTARRDLKK